MPEPAGDGTVGAAAGVEIGPVVLLEAVPSARFSLAGAGVRRPGKGLNNGQQGVGCQGRGFISFGIDNF